MSYYENAVKLRPLIEKAVQSLPESDALQTKTLHPAWKPGAYYETGYRLVYDGELYRVLQSHNSLDVYPPDAGTESLYSRIDETHSGTKDEPIPYNGNIALEQGKYYSQDGITYYCFRDTVNPVYHALSDLVGLYVEVA